MVSSAFDANDALKRMDLFCARMDASDANGDRPGLGLREAGLIRQPGSHVGQAGPGQDGHPVPLRLPVDGELVTSGLHVTWRFTKGDHRWVGFE